jgi:hypothetical protein
VSDEPESQKKIPDMRRVLEAVVIIGCFVVIVAPGNATNDSAAFGLLGVIVASLVSEVARR